MKILIRMVILTFCISIQPSMAQRGPVPVFITPVQTQQFVDVVEALGTLKANQNVALTSSITELITVVHFTDGQRVKKGDLLIQMDASEEIALKVEEQARMAEARSQVDRLKPLTSRGAASQSALDEQKLQLQTSKARLAAIESQIRQRKIVAPFDGVVGFRNISVGALSQPGTLITTIDDDSLMKLDFSVPEIFLSALKKGIKIEAKSSAWPDDVFTGEVGSVNSRVDPMTRSVSVRAFIKNPDSKLRPGMLMRVELQNNPRNALVIPEESIVTKGRDKFVFVLEESDSDNLTVSQSKVVIGSRREGQVEIKSGLEQGQKIVTHGTLRLRSGAAVEVKAVDDGQKPLKQMLSHKPNQE